MVRNSARHYFIVVAGMRHPFSEKTGQVKIYLAIIENAKLAPAFPDFKIVAERILHVGGLFDPGPDEEIPYRTVTGKKIKRLLKKEGQPVSLDATCCNLRTRSLHGPQEGTFFSIHLGVLGRVALLDPNFGERIEIAGQ